MENTVIKDICVRPQIAQLNQVVQGVKDVAINAIYPIYNLSNGQRSLDSFRVQMEGPPRTLTQLNQILWDSNLLVS